MTIGPPGPDVDFVPTQTDQVIALPFTVMLFMPVVSGAHVPLAVGGVGELPPVLSPPSRPELPELPELPLDPGLPELPGLPLDPGLPELPGLPLDPGLPELSELPLDPEPPETLEPEPLFAPLDLVEPEAGLPFQGLPELPPQPVAIGNDVPHARAAPNPTTPRARRMSALPSRARARPVE
jgi:hypothetical protein